MDDPRLLLFPLGDGGDEMDRLAGAMRVARSLGAHLRVLHSALDPTALLPRDVAVPGTVLQGLAQAFTGHADQDVDRLRALFETLCAEHGLSSTPSATQTSPEAASWVEVRGVRSALVAHHGKLADWILVSRPVDGQPSASLQAAVLQSGRPVLMLPRRLQRLDLQTVVVAWNGSPQAVRAVAAAHGLLRRAGQVLLVTTRDVERRGPRVTEVAGYLERHSIPVRPCVLEADDAGAGPALLGFAGQERATALVMGGYGTRKVRDLMLGSVTAHVIGNAAMPVLMAS